MYNGPIETEISIYNNTDALITIITHNSIIFYLRALFGSETNEKFRKTKSYFLWQQRPN